MTVEKIEELTVFKTTDGQLHPTMDAACDHQEAVEFAAWLEANAHVLYLSASEMAAQVLKAWRVVPREAT